MGYQIMGIEGLRIIVRASILEQFEIMSSDKLTKWTVVNETGNL